jgi:hypothetical protein
MLLLTDPRTFIVLLKLIISTFSLTCSSFIPELLWIMSSCNTIWLLKQIKYHLIFERCDSIGIILYYSHSTYFHRYFRILYAMTEEFFSRIQYFIRSFLVYHYRSHFHPSLTQNMVYLDFILSGWHLEFLELYSIFLLALIRDFIM